MRTLLIALMLFTNTLLQAQSGDSLMTFDPSADVRGTFFSANEAYQSGDYERSIELYRQILNEGKESAELYFNLGNALFKSGDNTHAILNYERALKLKPEDEDIRTNLEIANLKTIDKVEGKPEIMLSTWWKELLNSNTIDGWGKWSIYFIFAALVIMGIYLLTRGIVQRITFFLGMTLVACSIILMFLGYRLKSIQTNSEYAIVTTPTVTVKSSPETDGTKLFVIHEGTKVQCLDVVGEWTEISLMNGNKGWVKSETFENI